MKDETLVTLIMIPLMLTGVYFMCVKVPALEDRYGRINTCVDSRVNEYLMDSEHKQQREIRRANGMGYATVKEFYLEECRRTIK